MMMMTAPIKLKITSWARFVVVNCNFAVSINSSSPFQLSNCSLPGVAGVQYLSPEREDSQLFHHPTLILTNIYTNAALPQGRQEWIKLIRMIQRHHIFTVPPLALACSIDLQVP